MGNEENMNTAIAAQDESVLNKFLAELEASGQVKVRDLFPSLNGYLTEKGPGACGVYKVLDYLPEAVDSDLQPGQKSDVVNLIDMEGHRWAFYASNGGTKAKFRGVSAGEILILFYAGKQKSATKGFSDWHDYRVISARDQKTAEAIMVKASATMKFLKA